MGSISNSQLVMFNAGAGRSGHYNDDCLTFQEKILERSGLGDNTAWPIPVRARCGLT